MGPDVCTNGQAYFVPAGMMAPFSPNATFLTGGCVPQYAAAITCADSSPFCCGNDGSVPPHPVSCANNGGDGTDCWDCTSMC